MAKIKIEDIKTEVEAKGWRLLSTEYKNLDTELEFVCNEGHKIFLPWSKVRNKVVCPICEKNNLKAKKIDKTPRKGKKVTLALDQATHTTGFSVYYDTKLVEYGSFKTTEEDPIERIKTVKEWLISMVEKHQPDLIALEGIQLEDDVNADVKRRIGVTTFQVLAELLGCLKLTCHELGIEYLICPTNTWRNHCHVKGRHRADKKKSMILLVKKWYDITITDDEADAIGIGKYAAETKFFQPDIVEWE